MNQMILQRFVNNIDYNSNGCWEWKGTISKDGYARFSISGKSLEAHKIIHIIQFGDKSKGKRELVHVVDGLSKSDYVDQKIATTVHLKAPHGTVNLWFNEYGTVIGLDYYKEVFVQ